MNEELQKEQDYSGIVNYLGDIQNCFEDGIQFQYQYIEMTSFDNQHDFKTYQIHLFGNNIRCNLKQGDLAVLKNGVLFNVSENTIFLRSFTKSQILIGEKEIFDNKGQEQLKLEQYQQEQQQQLLNSQHELQNFKGIICKIGSIKKKKVNGEQQKFRIISFMNFNEQRNFQLYKIKLVGARIHQKIKINQRILIKNVTIRSVHGQNIRLKNNYGENQTQIHIGIKKIKQNMDKDEYKRFISQMRRQADQMNFILNIRRSRKINKNF